MYRHGKQCRCLECPKKRSATGRQPEKSRQLELLLGIGDRISSHISEQREKTIELSSCTPESVATSSEKTLTDNPVTSSCNFRKGKRLKKSEEDSTSSAKGLIPFWDELCQEMSNKLWSATKTDLLDLESTITVGFVSKTIANSWFSVVQTSHQKENSLKISLLSSTSLVVDCTDSGNIKLKSRKIRIYPNKQLAQIWSCWIAASRWCFNQAITILKVEKIGKYDLRKRIMNASPDWVNNTPYNPRQLAVFQAIEAHKAAKKAGGQAAWRSVREPVKSIRFQKDNWKSGTFYPSLTKNQEFKSTELIPEVMAYEPVLLLDRGRWFICFAEQMKVKSNNSSRVLAIDPGVRSFVTGFDGSDFIEVGRGDIGRIQRLCSHLDKLMSRIGKVGGHSFKRLRYKLRKASERIRVKIRCLIDELHHKLSAYLTSAYGLIFLPTFETSQMVVKSRRKLNNKTARNMLTWSHYRFKQTLKHHAVKRSCTVVDVTEEYTSKTCSKCGQLRNKLGGNKIFKCPIPDCKHIMERDKNGAFNIMLKALRDTSLLKDKPYSVVFG